MRLDQLISSEIMPCVPSHAGAVNICGLASDSRDVAPGYLFAALPGGRVDGATYIEAACARGAQAVVTSMPRVDLSVSARLPVVTTAMPRQVLAQIAARFFGYQPEHIAAVTGTNGKTSVAVFTRSLLVELGHCAASLGTLGAFWDSGASENSGHYDLMHTTPPPIILHRHLRDLHARGVNYLVLEASSHGLDQARLDGVVLAVAGFTHLSRDHLDYHLSAADYFAAKARLFCEVLPHEGIAVIDVGRPSGEQMAAVATAAGREVVRVADVTDTPDGSVSGAAIYVRRLGCDGRGQHLRVHLDGHDYDVDFPFFGDFQRSNLVVALGLAWSLLGGDSVCRDALVEAISNLCAVRGRMEHIGASAVGADIFVDYAHTPDALAAVLGGLRPHVSGRIILVFGAGGARDGGKRRQMGEVASALADHIIITDDNPRDENPSLIRAVLAQTCPGAENIGDRGDAITRAILLAGADDTVLVAGKGHERVQIVGDVAHDFNDATVIRAVLAQQEGSDG